MALITTAVQKQAARLGIALDAPLSADNAAKIRAALDDIGVSASVAEIQSARDEIAAQSQQHVADAGDRTKALRDATAGNSGAVGTPSSAVGVRAGNVAVFDAAASLKAAFQGEMAAAGTLQWRNAETTGLSIGGPKTRWIPSDAELAKMDKTSLHDLFGGPADVFAYWPKTAAERAPGATIYMTRKGVFGDEYASLSLRAPKPSAPTASTTTPAQASAQTVRDALKNAGVDGKPLVRGNDSIEVYMFDHFKEARAALAAAGFVDVRVPDPYTGYDAAAQKDPATGAVVRFLKDEVGGGV